MLKALSAVVRDRERLTEIVAIATRHGLGALLHRLGIATDGPDTGSNPDDDTALPDRVRRAMEDLGPTFVKLGQILATRGDLLTSDWIAAFERLHSNAPTLPFGVLRDAVEAALGEPPETAFATFDPAPLAAASMAQVHRATLHDGPQGKGRAVVLKIRRPGIRPRMEADLRLIAQAAAIVETTSVEARRFAPVALVRQLAQAMLEELDFTSEGRNADRLRADFADDPRVVVPVIHWAWTSETLLVMDFVDGVRPTDGAALRDHGIDPVAIAGLGADVVLDMVLIHGRFHGDPHPGNLLCLPGDRIALLDLGMIGHVPPRRRVEVMGFVRALDAGDSSALADILTRWSQPTDVPPARIAAAADRLAARHGGGPLVLSAVVADILPLMRDEGLTLPPDLLLLFKALVTIDGVLARICPGFDMTAAVRRASLRIAKERLSPDHWGPIATALAWDLAAVGDDAPRLVRAAVRLLEDRAQAARPDPAADPVALAVTRAGRWIALAIGAAGVAITAALTLAH
ncbi:ubiquinone biosynthesis protein [Sphingomonas sp. Leaf17]|uniref:ABC1 kinase family protein n=1 Tax=Sphingomonas sp. Leaf17 TaxID=1735683 RepID=UPI000701F89B|nr:AarF/ABC1/UbiB kinase family protein [Sphingomonas sp. Leaf17]KQM64381.1 ubiquinone biosynthesis protein [Sphingomonas sp. Leaf17]